MYLCCLPLIGLVCFLVNYVQPCAYVGTPKGIKVVAIGPNSGPNDDDKSLVTCPDEYSMQECYSTVLLKSDGVVPSEDATSGKIQCEVWNQYKNPDGIQAVAVCVKGDYSAETIAVLSGESFEASPKAQCPQGYKIETCQMLNPWSQDSCHLPKIDDLGTSCVPETNCQASPKGCKAYATCRPIPECPDAL